VKSRARRFSAIFFFFLAGLSLPSLAAEKKKASGGNPHWVADVPIPKNEKLFLVLKGSFSDKKSAEDLRRFIQQLMVKVPGDGIDSSSAYSGLPAGKYIVGTLFDTRERALWWMDFSYRNRKVGKGTIKEVTVTGDSSLPYMPSASRPRPKALVSEAEAMAQVKALPDVKRLATRKKLHYKFTDYPRNGDLRYEIEVLEDKGKKDPIMVDFVMVSAINGQVVERLSEALGQKIE
jgi:hypothetical protein